MCHCRGFWRLLIVREGRAETFLPFPAIAPSPAAADGSNEQQQQQQRNQRRGQVPDPAVLKGCSLQDLPVEKWVVQNPLAAAAAGAEGIPLSEVGMCACFWLVGGA
jgi:hypothetical protein